MESIKVIKKLGSWAKQSSKSHLEDSSGSGVFGTTHLVSINKNKYIGKIEKY